MGRAGAVSFDYEASQPGPGSPSVRVIRPSARKAHDLLPVEIFSERSGQERFRKDLLYWSLVLLARALSDGDALSPVPLAPVVVLFSSAVLLARRRSFYRR
jgi:hypothetical protein